MTRSIGALTVLTDVELELQSIRERASRVTQSVPANQERNSRCAVDQRKWDFRFLFMAQVIASWSKDPSTKCGAVIVDDQHRVISTGYNGFACNVVDYHQRYSDRDCKLDMVIHAEENALLFADRASLRGATIYTQPFLTCSRCAAKLIQVGIRRVVAPDLIIPRWKESLDRAKRQYLEADCQLMLYPTIELAQFCNDSALSLLPENGASLCTATLSPARDEHHATIEKVQ